MSNPTSLSNLPTPEPSRPASPANGASSSVVDYAIRSLPGSRAPSPVAHGIAPTPGSSRPPSPLLKPMANLSLSKESDSKDGGDDDEKKDDEAPAPARPSVGLKRTSSKRLTDRAMAPYTTAFTEFSPQPSPAGSDDEGDNSPATGSAAAEHTRLEKVALIGSGSWGTALGRIAAINAATKAGFDKTVNMWVREREVPGKGKLTELINSTHENHRYLPRVELPHNLVAVSSLRDVVKDATLLILCVPHQFLPPVMAELKKPGVLTPGARAISAIKGIEVTKTDIFTYPQIIERELGMPCSALGGANIANEVANNDFCETTIGVPGPKDAQLWHAVFDTDMFHVHCVEDTAGVSLSGALKNVVALAAGFVDGMDMGGNTKAAILRIGLLEMSSFASEFFPTSRATTVSLHSAGVADLITTSFGGRNRKCAEAFVRTKKSFEQLEDELLNGQKLQGVVTTDEIVTFLRHKGREDAYPLFSRVYKIAFEGMDPRELFTDL